MKNNLKTLRKKTQLKQKELAEKVQKPQNYISDLENGHRDITGISLKTAIKIAKILNCRPEDLIKENEQ